MDELQQSIQDLVVANRILANEGVLDGYGHVSVRHPTEPNRFLLSRSLSPEFVTAADIIEFDLNAAPVRPESRPLYLERFIHAGVYEARPDVNAVVHAHSEDVLPFTISDVPLDPVIHSVFSMDTPGVWDIADEFGDETRLLVENLDHGRALARFLQDGSLALMRGHGFVAASPVLGSLLRLCVYLPRNARVLYAAKMLGGSVKALKPGERASRRLFAPDHPAIVRGLEHWAIRAGCSCTPSGRFLAESAQRED